MPQENVVFYNPIDELDDDLNVNFKKIWKIIWSRKALLIKVFCSVLAFFILLTFIMPKKYKVTADLYINKANNSNMMEVNPYVLNEASGSVVTMETDKVMNNEIELIKSELVLDNVIKDNNIRYKKKFGFIPNRKEGEYLSAKNFYNKGKYLKIDNKKNTNVISIEYKAKKPETAYGVVSSLIANYIELHKELNSEKSKTDKNLLEAEYATAKESLNKKLSRSSGLPAQSMTGIGNLTALSAFSKSASSAVGSIRGQYLAEERSQIAINEEKQKVAQLASKLEWAKMVEQMSDSSKVLVLNEPKQPRPFENSSPKLLINIILGCVFGFLLALFSLIYVELKSSKLTYSMLTNDVIFNGFEKINNIKIKIKSFNSKKVLIISLVQLPNEFLNAVQNIPNCGVVYYNGTDEFVEKMAVSDKIILVSKIDTTSADSYKIVRDVIKDQHKNILCDILI